GVPDYLDKCPNTPAGVSVDKQGCPLDSDKDGVPDYLDKCPNTIAGAQVDVDGCEIKLSMVLEFGTDKAEITKAHQVELAKAIKFIQKYPSQKVHISGHTDCVGAAAYNKKLSLRRADAVKANFVAAGIKADRLVVEGFGEERPVADNNTDAGRKLNRRVDVTLLK
ncbi:MAG: OmpA family protein, partial [Desulfuromonas sp.]|nr:OmpA family protein [Desulfuromonas sp.]